MTESFILYLEIGSSKILGLSFLRSFFNLSEPFVSLFWLHNKEFSESSLNFSECFGGIYELRKKIDNMHTLLNPNF